MSCLKVEEIGESWEGRPIYVMKICYNKCGSKPIYWIDSAIHPRERISPAVVTFFTQVQPNF